MALPSEGIASPLAIPVLCGNGSPPTGCARNTGVSHDRPGLPRDFVLGHLFPALGVFAHALACCGVTSFDQRIFALIDRNRDYATAIHLGSAADERAAATVVGGLESDSDLLIIRHCFRISRSDFRMRIGHRLLHQRNFLVSIGTHAHGHSVSVSPALAGWVNSIDGIIADVA
jgi:hypothetical protein